jgi:hypothetical protein
MEKLTNCLDRCSSTHRRLLVLVLLVVLLVSVLAEHLREPLVLTLVE